MTAWPRSLALLSAQPCAGSIAGSIQLQVNVWPNGHPETICTDHWRCRFQAREPGAEIAHAQIVSLLCALNAEGFDFIKMENLYNFDGKPGYALGQGQ